MIQNKSKIIKMKNLPNKLFCFGIVIPTCLWSLWFIYRSLAYHSVLGNARQFDFCDIIQYDPETGATYTQKETV